MMQENTTETSETQKPPRVRKRRGSDPVVFAILQWPAVAGLIELPNTWWGLALKCLLGIWVLALHSAAFRGRYAARPDFGFLIFCLNLAFVGAWLAYPHSGSGVWAALALILILAGIGVARKLPDR